MIMGDNDPHHIFTAFKANNFLPEPAEEEN